MEEVLKFNFKLHWIYRGGGGLYRGCLINSYLKLLGKNWWGCIKLKDFINAIIRVRKRICQEEEWRYRDRRRLNIM